jgi:hypothetical protein
MITKFKLGVFVALTVSTFTTYSQPGVGQPGGGEPVPLEHEWILILMGISGGMIMAYYSWKRKKNSPVIDQQARY